LRLTLILSFLAGIVGWHGGLGPDYEMETWFPVGGFFLGYVGVWVIYAFIRWVVIENVNFIIQGFKPEDQGKDQDN